ncbi:Uncharacterised protein [uncultured archaeon]|nr:Uncharacterised protein [uncultured archaeon]
MNKKRWLYSILLSISILYFIYLVIGFFTEGKFFYPKSFNMKLIFCGLTAVIIILILFLFSMDRYSVHKKIGFFSINIHIIEAMLIIILIIFISALGGLIVYDYYFLSQKQEDYFSIGIYLSVSIEPINFSGEYVNNPVLTKFDILGTSAEFIADPFLIHENSTFYMFFEIYSSITSQGDIGLAVSNNGINWSYKQIVLDESFHLSYPCVFKYNNQYYMIPETAATHSIRLYQAHDFPYNWSFVKTLIGGRDFVDNTIFYYNNTWWLFTETKNDHSLHLYFSDSPVDIWLEHPLSPIISQDANISRPGGNVIVYNNRIFRYAQDDYPSYGEQVWGFEITELTKKDYNEKRISNKPILKGYDNWNKLGMHQISICKIDNKWIAAVDGKGHP